MADTADLLALAQWLSPAFPTGAFAYSHALEQAVALGEVADADGVSAWLAATLEHGAGWNDAVILALGLDAATDLAALTQTTRALAPSAERLRETMEQGAAFGAAWAATSGHAPPAPAALPVAVARAARALSLPPAQIVALYLHGWASSLTSAAVRFVPLGQAAGQQVLARQHGLIQRLADRAVQAGVDDLANSAFRGDTLAMAHETLEVRIFKT